MPLDPTRGYGSNKHQILQSEIEFAWTQVTSAAAVARYLNIAYPTYLKYAKMYGIHKTNQYGHTNKRSRRKGAFGLDEILSGGHPNYNRTKLKYRLIKAGYLEESCSLCGFDKKRMFDNKCPLILIYRDGDNKNINLDNLELRCYNCTYLTTGRVHLEQMVKRDAAKYSSVNPVDPGTVDQDLERSGITADDIEAIQSELMSKD
jgi:hypothetical protein